MKCMIKKLIRSLLKLSLLALVGVLVGTFAQSRFGKLRKNG